MRKFILPILAIAILLPFTANADDDRPIAPEKLPAAAKTFIQSTFPETAIAYAEVDKEVSKTKYEVRLNDGTEISFNGKGAWYKVDCQHKAVPASLVPKVIADYVQANYAGAFIEKIEKERFGWGIELSNELELDFSADGKLLRIDD